MSFRFRFVRAQETGFKINERHVSEKLSENETEDKIMEQLFRALLSNTNRLFQENCNS